MPTVNTFIEKVSFAFRNVIKRFLRPFPRVHNILSTIYITKYAASKKIARLKHAKFLSIQKRFGKDLAAKIKYLKNTYEYGTLVDPSFIRIIRKLKDDFHLRYFVETGTYQGDTSFFFSLIFEKVFTCDIIDHPRKLEFYLRDNLIYETKSSPAFFQDHLDEIKTDSLFFLDAHWMSYWPLRDELAIVFNKCRDPIVIVDDFDAGNGLGFDAWDGHKLNYEYIQDLVPADYKFCLNTWSYTNRGIIFLFPGTTRYGCPFKDRDKYIEAKHGLWDRP